MLKNKQKRYWWSLLAVILLLLLGHFVPLYSGKGVIDAGDANLCIGYLDFEPDDYRIIPNGCARPVILRLYLW
jgi:hypothetical protein